MWFRMYLMWSLGLCDNNDKIDYRDNKYYRDNDNTYLHYRDNNYVHYQYYNTLVCLLRYF